jgi:hypothetical protein
MSKPDCTTGVVARRALRHQSAQPGGFFFQPRGRARSATATRFDVETAYERVAVVRTAVTLRAKRAGVAAVGDRHPARDAGRVRRRNGWRRSFRGVEIDLCLYGAAYLFARPRQRR